MSCLAAQIIRGHDQIKGVLYSSQLALPLDEQHVLGLRASPSMGVVESALVWQAEG